MSKKQYDAIERHALDTWAFIGFMVIMGAISYWNTL